MKQTSIKKHPYNKNICYLGFETIEVRGNRIRIKSSQKRLSDYDNQKE